MNKKIIDKLIGMSACGEGVEYARSYRTMQEAWDRCERGDWLLWLLGRLAGPPESKSRKKLVLAACACARLSLDHIPAGEQRPLAAIEMAEAWARGQDGASLDDVRRTASTAYAAYAAAYAASTAFTAYAYAAYATAYAASTAYAAAYAASTASASAASTAYAAAYAATATATASAYASATASAYASARKKTLLQCAEIVRSMYSKAPGLKGEQG